MGRSKKNILTSDFASINTGKKKIARINTGKIGVTSRFSIFRNSTSKACQSMIALTNNSTSVRQAPEAKPALFNKPLPSYVRCRAVGDCSFACHKKTPCKHHVRCFFDLLKCSKEKTRLFGTRLIDDASCSPNSTLLLISRKLMLSCGSRDPDSTLSVFRHEFPFKFSDWCRNRLILHFCPY